LNFISDGSTKEMPAFYTNSEELKETKMTIDKILKENEELELTINVYPLEYLFFPLKKITTQLKNDANGTNDIGFQSIYLAKDMIDRDKYRYSLNIGCEHHDQLDCPIFCSLAKVKRWGFTIADYCVQDLRLPFIPGQHVPKECDNEAFSLPDRNEQQRQEIDGDSVWSQLDKSSNYNSDNKIPWKNPDNSKYEDKFSSSFRHSEYPTLSETNSISEQSHFSRQTLLDEGVRPSEDYTSYATVTTGRGSGIFRPNNSVNKFGMGRGIQKYQP
jgi:hypothetical protein